MFDIGADELLLTAVVAIVVIGPKDLPRAMRVAGKWVAKMRKMSNAFRSGFENMVREAELEEMEREWKERNAAIMAAHPAIAPDAEADAMGAAAASQGYLPPAAHPSFPAEPYPPADHAGLPVADRADHPAPVESAPVDSGPVDAAAPSPHPAAPAAHREGA